MADVALNVRLNDREARASLQSFLSEIRKVETSGITLNINPQTATNVNAISQAFQRLSATNSFRQFEAAGQAIDHVTQQIQHNRVLLQELYAIYGRFPQAGSQGATAIENVRLDLADLGRELANLTRTHQRYEEQLQNTGAYKNFIEETRRAAEETERLNRAQQTAAVDRAIRSYSAERLGNTFSHIYEAINGLSGLFNFASNIVDQVQTLPGIASLSSITNSMLSAPFSGLSGAVASGFGGSVERYDVLRSFPQVMQSIGYGATESAVATDRLRDSILGLPVALNEVVENAQYFTLLTGDLEKATDLTIALNNAFIASGASQEQISTGTRVLTYLLEGATLTTRQWFSLIRSMPVGLKYVGESLGYVDLQSFTKDLRQGKIDTDQFVDSLIEVGLHSTELNSILDVFKNKVDAAVTNLGIAAQRMGASLLSGLNDALGGESYGVTGAIRSFGSILDNLGEVGAQWIRDHSVEINSLLDRFLSFDWESFLNGALQGLLDSLETAMSFIERISSMTGTDLFGQWITGGDAFVAKLKVISSILSTIGSILKTTGEAFLFRSAMAGFRGPENRLIEALEANPIGAEQRGYRRLVVGDITRWYDPSGRRIENQTFGQRITSKLSSAVNAINTFAVPVAAVAAVIGTVELIKDAVDLANKGTNEADELIGEVNNSLDSMTPLNLDNFASNEQTMRGLIESINSRIDENSAILSNVKSSGGWSTLLGRGVSVEELNSYHEGNEKLRQQREKLEQRLLEYDRITSDPRYKYISDLGGVDLNFMGVDTAQVISGIQNDVFNAIRDGEEINSYVLAAAEAIIANADGWVEAYNLANNRVTSAQNEVSRIEEELAKTKEKTPKTYTQISKYQSIWGKGNKYLSQQLEEDPEADFLYRNTRRDWLKLGTKGMQDLNDLKSWLISSFRNGKLTASQASIYGQMLDDLATDPAGNSKRIEKLKREIQESAQENTSFGWETWDDSFLQEEEGYNAQVLTYQEQQLSWELETAQNELTAAEEQLSVTVENLTNAFLETVRPIIAGFVPGLWEMMFSEVDSDEAEESGNEKGNELGEASGRSFVSAATLALINTNVEPVANAALNLAGRVTEAILAAFTGRVVNVPSPKINFGFSKGNENAPDNAYTRAAGGTIPSIGTDTVPAMLTPGEYVHRRAVVQHYGKAFMDRINNLDLQGALATLSMSYVTPFATGGLVRSDNRSYRDNHASIVQNFNNSRSDYSFRRANRFVRGLA